MVGVLVMLNNFFHDLSVALFTCGVLGLGAIWRAAETAPEAARPVYEALDRLGKRVVVISMILLTIFGAVRGITFETYEWNPAVGRDQVPALVVKHILLSVLLIYAVSAIVRARAKARQRRQLASEVAR